MITIFVVCKTCGMEYEAKAYIDNGDIMLVIPPCIDCIRDAKDEGYQEGYQDAKDEV